ncbi:hypothetical protein QBC41DRAFT_358103 [Cercophora samala]|uniref:Uncharacterized protein n=1 Tax=Cercophora samala TaxID=330535 RepID=A0AA39Z905_9PEZI|nr:hypothetical protein QBC41DRAFT_358103 [Cercophora samala]
MSFKSDYRNYTPQAPRRPTSIPTTTTTPHPAPPTTPIYNPQPPRRPTSLLSHLTPEQQAVIITARFEGAPATGVIPPGYQPPTYDPKYDLPEYSWDNLLLKFYQQTQESYIMEEEIKAENARRKITGELPCQSIPEGYVPPTYDPKYDLPEYSFEALLEKYKRQTEESYVMEAEIREEQRERLERARRYQAARRMAEEEAEKEEDGEVGGEKGEQGLAMTTPPASRQASLS